MTPEEAADKIISNLADRSFDIGELDEDLQAEIRAEMIETIKEARNAK